MLGNPFSYFASSKIILQNHISFALALDKLDIIGNRAADHHIASIYFASNTLTSDHVAIVHIHH